MNDQNGFTENGVVDFIKTIKNFAQKRRQIISVKESIETIFGVVLVVLFLWAFVRNLGKIWTSDLLIRSVIIAIAIVLLLCLLYVVQWSIGAIFGKFENKYQFPDKSFFIKGTGTDKLGNKLIEITFTRNRTSSNYPDFVLNFIFENKNNGKIFSKIFISFDQSSEITVDLTENVLRFGTEDYSVYIVNDENIQTIYEALIFLLKCDYNSDSAKA